MDLEASVRQQQQEVVVYTEGLQILQVGGHAQALGLYCILQRRCSRQPLLSSLALTVVVQALLRRLSFWQHCGLLLLVYMTRTACLLD